MHYMELKPEEQIQALKMRIRELEGEHLLLNIQLAEMFALNKAGINAGDNDFARNLQIAEEMVRAAEVRLKAVYKMYEEMNGKTDSQ